MTEKSERRSSSKPKIEGEGSYEAAEHYKQSVDEYLAQNDPAKKGKQARKALEGKEGKELREAERQGKKPARH